MVEKETSIKEAKGDPIVDNFFVKAENTKPYFKAAFEGFAGSGKTYTASLIAVGLHKKIGSKKPVVIFDTEKAAKFVRPIFEKEGIELLVRDSKSLADLKETMRKLREEKVSDVLIIDSISHVWEQFLQTYMDSKRRTQLQFQDWGVIKPTWKREFSDRLVNDPYHIIMCGRAGYEYGNEINEETGKREIFKSGIKMKVEGETAYEPDILVLMERFEEVTGKDKAVWREATVIKDRSALLDGKVFKNPTYEDFAPVVEIMIDSPTVLESEAERNTEELFGKEDNLYKWKREKKRWQEEIEGLLISVWPAAVGKDKQFKLDAIEQAFGTRSWTAVEDMSVERLKEGLDVIKEHIENYKITVKEQEKEDAKIKKEKEDKKEGKDKKPVKKENGKK